MVDVKSSDLAYLSEAAVFAMIGCSFDDKATQG